MKPNSMRTKVIKMLFVCLLVQASISNAQTLHLPSLFSDEMVIQRSTKMAIWGTSTSNEHVWVNTSWGKLDSTMTNQKGEWVVWIETPRAGGPYSISIRNKSEEKKINDILSGEVWLCSGQSNMEMPMFGWPPNDTISNSAYEISHANTPSIRMFTASHSLSIVPEQNSKGKWKTANPTNVKEFSATGYYFARKLQKELNVPIGIINTSWGGTPIKSWIGVDSLVTYEEFKNLKTSISSLKGGQEAKEKWLEKHPVIDLSNRDADERWMNLDFNDADCATKKFNDSDWDRMKLPMRLEKSSLGDFDGAVWFRKTIDVPVNFRNKPLILLLPSIDDMDRTYANGLLVGKTEKTGYWQSPRNYVIPAFINNGRKLSIAIRVIDHQGGGGIWDTNQPFELQNKLDTTQRIKLAGIWQYLAAAEYKNELFYLFDIKSNEFKRNTALTRVGPGFPSVLYNGMIHPIAPYTIKGFLWYQGESNVGEDSTYAALMKTMVNNWRKTWNNDSLPFYFVEIAPFKYSGIERIESALIRNAQFEASQTIKNSGLVVTLDIGDLNCIHPPNKVDVGERLALWALAKQYQKPIQYSGPVYQSHRIEQNTVRIQFSNAQNGLKLTTRPFSGFELCGSDKVFLPAKAVIENNELVISNETIKNPVQVRYAWRNGSEATLFNVEGLPASTFITK